MYLAPFGHISSFRPHKPAAIEKTARSGRVDERDFEREDLRDLTKLVEESETGATPSSERTSTNRPANALEICCGHAGLVYGLTQTGIDARGIDWKGNKHAPRMPILQIDLATTKGRQMVPDLQRTQI